MQRGRDGLFELKMIQASPRVKPKGRGSEYGSREMILQGFYMPLWAK